MVGTRKHPGGDFPQTPTPPASTTARAEPESTKHTARSKSLSRRSDVPKSASSLWTHTPSNLTLLWLAISLPLVIWDTGYVLLRPHSMPGGKLHAPIWKPYALYGTVDYMYGWPAWNNHNGFTAAQGSINLVETIGYGIYLGIVYTYGKDEKVKGRGAPHRLSAFGKVTENLRRLSRARVLSDREAVWATLLGFSISLATVLKTILYGKLAASTTIIHLYLQIARSK